MTLDDELRDLISKLIDGRLSPQDSQRLQQLLVQSPEAVGTYHELMDNHEALCAIYPGDIYADTFSAEPSLVPVSDALSGNWRSFRSAKVWATAAAVLIAVGLTGYFLGAGQVESRQVESRQTESGRTAVVQRDNGLLGTKGEQTLAGHATLRRSVDVVWGSGATVYREGDVLPDGRLQFAQGIAEFDFFCGATLIVEGPAVLDIESDWSVEVIEGRLRANVPPAARGFLVKAAGTEIVDLGTEFAVNVGADNAQVEVIDGEIAIRGGRFDGEHLLTGQKQVLRGVAQSETDDQVSTLADLSSRFADAETQRMADWQTHTKELAQDDRLIAFFPMAQDASGRFARNRSASGSNRDGKLIGPVERTAGRFGNESAGLKFSRPGARVRTRIDGVFDSFTFACWAKIDSLDHVYNALFMADSYQTGEPHWQIRNDGRLMFSVMVDDTKASRHYSEFEAGMVDSAGLARVYYSEPFWDISKSGQWFHLAAVFDPINKRVDHYINGQLQISHDILPKYQIDQLRLGPAEIGNWGQPFRKTPWFAVRNFNGTIDELAIFDAALDANEIKTLYEKGKPLGY